MASREDEELDSRTMSTGKKRSLDAYKEVDNNDVAASSSSQESVTSKHPKTDLRHPREQSFSPPPLPPEDIQDIFDTGNTARPATKASPVQVSAPVISWNQGVQGALRTSFGNKNIKTATELEGQTISDVGNSVRPDGPPKKKRTRAERKAKNKRRETTDDAPLSENTTQAPLRVSPGNEPAESDVDAMEYSPPAAAEPSPQQPPLPSGPPPPAEPPFTLPPLPSEPPPHLPSLDSAPNQLTQNDNSLFELALLNRHYYPGSEQIRCMLCLAPAHQSGSCPSLTCTYCFAHAVHPSTACPENKTCTKCYQTGHTARTCPSKLAASASERPPCGRCNSTTHDFDSCSLLWRTFTVPDLSNVPSSVLMRRSDMNISCYVCGHTNHLGTECGLRRANRGAVGGAPWTLDDFNVYLAPEEPSVADRAASPEYAPSLTEPSWRDDGNRGMLTDYEIKEFAYDLSLQGLDDYVSVNSGSSITGSHANGAGDGSKKPRAKASRPRGSKVMRGGRAGRGRARAQGRGRGGRGRG